jgi:exoribonuclease R
MKLSHYTHFTSPIRRYVDQYIHQVMINTLFDGKLYTKHFETALKKAYQKFNSNSPTENIFV